MPNQVQTGKDRTSAEIGVWLYARKIISEFFRISFQTKYNQYALANWLRNINPNKINAKDEFIANQEITIPADEHSAAYIIGQEIGMAISSGTITMVTPIESHLTMDERDDFTQFTNSIDESKFSDKSIRLYRGTKPIDLIKIKVIEDSPTLLDVRWVATRLSLNIPKTDFEIKQAINNRIMSLPNDTIYFPNLRSGPKDALTRAIMNHEIDHQYTYQVYDKKAVFEKLFQEQEEYDLYYKRIRQNQNPHPYKDPYDYMKITGVSFLQQITSFNDITSYEGQAKYIEDYSMELFAPNADLQYSKTDYKIFHI